MLLDTARAPVVFAYAHAASDLTLEESLTALLDREEPFVLVTDHAPEDDHGETHEERKQRTLFLKGLQQRFAALCRGLIVLEQGRLIPAPKRIAAATAGKAFGFQIVFAEDEAAAMAHAGALLAT